MTESSARPPRLPCPAEPYLPHAAPMALIDRVLAFAGDEIVAELQIRPDSMFVEDGAVPAWVGIEYMAQTIGSYAGLQAKAAGEAVKKGFLLGSRDLRLLTESFPVGQTLTVRAHKLTLDSNGLGSFDCELLDGDTRLAHGRLNVFQPENPDAMLEAGRG